MGFREDAEVALNRVLMNCDKYISHYPKLKAPLQELEEKTSIPASALFLIAVFLGVSLALVAIGFEGIAMIWGFAYPAYGSFKALQAEDTGAQDFFIKYWVFYAFLYMVDDVFTFLYSIPFYSFLKLVLTVWAFHPGTQGASKVYAVARTYLLPLLGIEAALPPPPPTKARKSLSESPDSYTIQVRLAARGLETSEPEETLDTYCCLRVVSSGSRRPRGAEGQWLKTSVNTLKPVDSPDWRGEAQTFISIPTLDDTVLEVIVKNKQAFKDLDLGRVRLPLKGTEPSYHGSMPLESVTEPGSKAAGELDLELTVTKAGSVQPPAAPQLIS